MMIRNDETLDDLLVGGLQVIQSRHGYRFLDAVLLVHFATLKVASGCVTWVRAVGSSLFSWPGEKTRRLRPWRYRRVCI